MDHPFAPHPPPVMPFLEKLAVDVDFMVLEFYIKSPIFGDNDSNIEDTKGDLYTYKKRQREEGIKREKK